MEVKRPRMSMTFKRFVLETTLCVLVCFIEFYVLVFDEIDVLGPKHLPKHIIVGNIRAQLSQDRPMGPWGGHKHWVIKLSKAAWFVLSRNQSTSWTLFMEGQIFYLFHRNNTDSTISEFIFENRAGTAPRRGLVFQQWFKKFKFSLTWLKGPISSGVFWVILGTNYRWFLDLFKSQFTI